MLVEKDKSKQCSITANIKGALPVLLFASSDDYDYDAADDDDASIFFCKFGLLLIFVVLLLLLPVSSLLMMT